MTRDSTAAPPIDAGWLAMTNEARRIQMRYANHHQGDVYHELQHLVTRFGAPWAPPREAVGDWVMVPREPTLAMAAAFRADAGSSTFYTHTTLQCADFASRYRAMLAAAPQQPATVDEAAAQRLADAVKGEPGWCYLNPQARLEQARRYLAIAAQQTGGA